MAISKCLLSPMPCSCRSRSSASPMFDLSCASGLRNESPCSCFAWMMCILLSPSFCWIHTAGLTLVTEKNRLRRKIGYGEKSVTEKIGRENSSTLSYFSNCLTLSHIGYGKKSVTEKNRLRRKIGYGENLSS
ncbi:hypothetical protein Ddc_17865 [Ditylenchus destructor]|nr:hypothetical protein Ddc_17865 [Ditylenchus destructor]